MILAHLSDPHLTSPANARIAELAGKRLLGYLSWRRRRRFIHRRDILGSIITDIRRRGAQQIMITGDLTHIALPEEFSEAGNWLRDLGNPDEISVIPGNHDAYVAVNHGKGLAHWDAYMRGDRADNNDPARFPSLRRRGPVALIGLSSAVPSAPLLATGTLGTEQLERLGELLASCAEKGLFPVLMIHHSPVPGHEKWRKRLTDIAALENVLSRHGAGLILHGHGHRRACETLHVGRHAIPVVGAPSASSNSVSPGRRAGYNLIEIDGNKACWQLRVTAVTRDPHSGHFDSHVMMQENRD